MNHEYFLSNTFINLFIKVNYLLLGHFNALFCVMRKYIAFMCHAPENQGEYLEEVLKEYDIGGYVIAEETEPYNHYHFLVEMEEADYTRYRKRVFIDKFKLRGQAKNGEPRQYGKVKEIEDFDKMLSYTVKDQNIRSNLSEEQINDAIDNSFKKEKPKMLKEKLTKYIDDKSLNSFGEPRDLRKKKILCLIIDWCRDMRIPLTKGILNSYYVYWRQFTKHKKLQFEADNLLREVLGDYEYDNLL